MRCPAPGMSHPRAGASTDIFEVCAAGFVVTASFLTEVSGIFALVGGAPAPRASSDDHEFSLYFTSYFGMVAADQHIHLAAHAEFLQVNSRFDGKAAVWQNPTLIVNFEIVHVGAVGVDFSSNGMPSAVDKILSVSRFGNAFANRIVHLPAGNLLARGDRIQHKPNACVPAGANNAKDFPHRVRRRFADETGPGDVVINRLGHILLAPNIQ